MTEEGPGGNSRIVERYAVYLLAVFLCFGVLLGALSQQKAAVRLPFAMISVPCGTDGVCFANGFRFTDHSYFYELSEQ